MPQQPVTDQELASQDYTTAKQNDNKKKKITVGLSITQILYFDLCKVITAAYSTVYVFYDFMQFLVRKAFFLLCN